MGSLAPEPEYDVLIIGAGLSGCYATYRMKKLGLKQKVLENGSSVGGTWYWSEYILSAPTPLIVQTATLELGLIANHTHMASHGQRNYLTNGTGQNISQHNPKPNNMFDIFVTDSNCGIICSSTHK